MSKRLSLLAAVAVTVVALVVGWRAFERGLDSGTDPGAGDSSAAPSASPSTDATEEPGDEPTPAAEIPETPQPGSCHRLRYADAVAPTASQGAVPCRGPHTSVTFAVTPLDTLVGGHLVTVDTDRVREQVAEECPRRFADYVGGTLEQRRLSLLRPVGFTPTVEQSDRGASWLRCDVVAVAEDNQLSPLTGDVEGALGTAEGRDRYGLCATAGPGEESARTVICSEDHSWRAVRTVDLGEGPYPGVETVRGAGEDVCLEAGREASGGALDFRWGYEWPSAERWREGRTFGICWVPV